MATGKVTAASNVAAQRQFSIPVVAPTQWSTICSDAMVADTVSPNPVAGNITRATQNWFQCAGWTTLQVRLAYVGTPNPTAPALETDIGLNATTYPNTGGTNTGFWQDVTHPNTDLYNATDAYTTLTGAGVYAKRMIATRSQPSSPAPSRRLSTSLVGR